MTAYDLLRRHCGLSQQQAADFHQVRLDTVNSGCLGRRTAKPEILAELRALDRTIAAAAAELGRAIAAALEGKDRARVGVELAPSAAEAKRLGLATTGMMETAIGRAIAALPDDVQLRLAEPARGRGAVALFVRD
jgi:hypothetical protein